MKHLHATVAVVAFLGMLVIGCSDDGEDVEAGRGGPPEADPAPGARPDAEPGSGDPLPPEFVGAMLDADDVPGWQQWQNPGVGGWFEQMMPDCDGETVPDRDRCGEVRSAVEQAEGGDLVNLTPYDLDDEGLPVLAEGDLLVGIDQIVVAFPDETLASLVLDAQAEASEGASSPGEGPPPVEPVEGLGDAAWEWDAGSDQWDVESAQPVAGRLIMFRRGRVVVQLLHTWAEGEEHPDTIELASAVDDRLTTAQD